LCVWEYWRCYSRMEFRCTTVLCVKESMFDYSYWRLSGKYNPNIRTEMNPPKLFICGHSHILKVMFDKKHNLLHMELRGKWFSPSAYHVRFVIDGDKIGYGNYWDGKADVVLFWYVIGIRNSCSKLIWELILIVPLSFDTGFNLVNSKTFQNIKRRSVKSFSIILNSDLEYFIVSESLISPSCALLCFMWYCLVSTDKIHFHFKISL
jgi:hypothetical protein